MFGFLARLALPQGLGKLLAYIGGAALVCALLWALWARGDHYKGQRDQARHQVTLEIASHRATKAAYRAAQAQAQEMETARLVRAKTVYERNNADAKQGYAHDIADLNSRYQRLREQERTRAIAFGQGSGVTVSEATPGSCRAFGATCTDELLAALRDAEETAIRLVALQGLVKRQAEVPVN